MTLCQWEETWSDSFQIVNYFLADFIFVTTFLQITAMVGDFHAGPRKCFKVNLYFLLLFFPEPTVALIHALEGQIFFQVSENKMLELARLPMGGSHD